jgi:uncharacterized protein YgfB (UPF0149 family)
VLDVTIIMMSEPADFDDVARALAAAGSTVDAAEAHGCLCGAACVRRDYGLADWLDDVVPEGGADGGVLESLRVNTLDALAGAQMEFQPLLPDDEQSLELRVAALAAWCQGFLYGFGSAGTAGHAQLPDTVAEVLADLAQFSHAGGVGTESADVEEAAYAELVEFVRAAVQLAYDELVALRASQPYPGTGH